MVLCISILLLKVKMQKSSKAKQANCDAKLNNNKLYNKELNDERGLPNLANPVKTPCDSKRFRKNFVKRL